jgi:hypothetical protein
MWIALFAITLAAAMCFTVAATLLQEKSRLVSRQSQRALPNKKNRRLIVTEFVRGCRDLSKTACAAFRPSWLDAVDVTGSPLSAQRPRGHLPDLMTGGVRQAALLHRRMRSLLADSDDFARSEPLLFRQLEIRCSRCESTTRCACDLALNSIDPRNEDWRNYCPNAPMLKMLSTLQACRSVVPLHPAEAGAGSSLYTLPCSAPIQSH